MKKILWMVIVLLVSQFVLAEDYMPYIDRAIDQKDYDKALLYLQKQKSLTPKNTDVFLAFGRAYEGKGENQLAIKCYTRSIEYDSTYYLPLVYRSCVYFAERNNQQAINDIIKAIQIYGIYVKKSEIEGIALDSLFYVYAEQDFGYARVILDSLIEKGETQWYNQKIQIYARRGMVDEIAEDARKIFLQRGVSALENDNLLEKVYTVVDQKPEFRGGERKLEKYLTENLRYPILAQEKSLQGRVVVAFIVHKDGTIDQVQVISGVCKLLDDEVIRFITAMPQWKPGKLNGESVDCLFTIPIVFRIAR